MKECDIHRETAVSRLTMVIAVALVMAAAAAGAWFVLGAAGLEAETDVAALSSSPSPSGAPASESPVTTPPPSETQPSETASSPSPSPNPTTFVISQDESTATYVVDEVLRGEDTAVEGTTNEVAGTITLDQGGSGEVTISEVLVNARTFSTSSQQRDNAVERRILDASEFELISFAPTEITGVPADLSVGDAATVDITGDLTIRGVTEPQTFAAEVTYATAERLEAAATTTVDRETYGLSIPDVPFVADVGQEVELRFDLVATAEQQADTSDTS